MKFREFLEDQKIFQNGHYELSPEISVVMPTYCRNQEGLLRPCIESVLSQTFRNFEFIIVDDGSVDGTKDVVQEYARKDPRIVSVRHEQNSGLPAVRTDEGILLSRAPYVAFMFDDNVWVPDFLECTLRTMKSYSADVVYCCTEMVQLHGKPSVMLGQWPLTSELLRNTNTIPNGGCLVRSSFFGKYGMYDPHIILRRSCDFDLWLRSYCQGARFVYLDKVSGLERGMASPFSIGSTINLDYKTAMAYTSCEVLRAERTEALKSERILDFDVFDPEKVMPYVRDIEEWRQVEGCVYKPFFDKHTYYKWQPPIMHNRRYEKGLQDSFINPPYPVTTGKRRFLLVTNRVDVFVDQWQKALKKNPDAIVLICGEWQLSAFSPRDADCIILFDASALFLQSFVQAFHDAGVPILYVVNHGTDQPHLMQKDPIAPLDLTSNEAILETMQFSMYFSLAGRPWSDEHSHGARQLRQCADAVLVFNGHPEGLEDAGEKVREIPFVANSLPALSETADSDLRLAMYLGNTRLLDSSQVATMEKLLKHTPQGATWELFCLDHSTLPSALSEYLDKTRLVWTNESLLTITQHLRGAYVVVGKDILSRYDGFERNLLEENLARNESVIADWDSVVADISDGLLVAAARKRIRDFHSLVAMRGRFARPDARELSLTNLVMAAIFREKQLSFTRRSGQEFARILIFLNSPLFAGSEVYGLLIMQGLYRAGLDAQACVPSSSPVAKDAGDISAWLSEKKLPPVLVAPYGMTQSGLLSLDEEKWRQFEAFQEWLDGQKAGTVFCSAFIPEPLFMCRNRLAYVALMNPYGQLLNYITMLRETANGIYSDSQWSTHEWGRFLPEAQCLPSIVESFHFSPPRSIVPGAAIRIAVGGTLQPRKRQLEAILACLSLLEEGWDLRLNIYGYELECFKEYIDNMKSVVKNSTFAERISLHGLVAMKDIIQDNDILLVSSIDESLPQTLLIAMAGGLLAVACPTGGIQDVVLHGKTGYLTSGFEPKDIASTLREAIVNQASWSELIAAGQKLLVEKYTEPKVINQLLTSMIHGAEIAQTVGYQLARQCLKGPDDKAQNQPFVPPAEVLPQRVAPPEAGILSRLIIGPDIDSRHFRYTLIADKPNLSGIRFFAATHLTLARGTIMINILDDTSNELIHQAKLNLASIGDNSWVNVEFQPIADSSNRRFRIVVAASVVEGRFAIYETAPERTPSLLQKVTEKVFRGQKRGQGFFPIYPT